MELGRKGLLGHCFIVTVSRVVLIKPKREQDREIWVVNFLLL